MHEKKPPVKAIAFDFGNTLVPFDAASCVRILARYAGLPPLDVDQILAESIEPRELGLDPETKERLVSFQPALHALYRHFNRRVNECRKLRGEFPFFRPALSIEKFFRIFTENVSTYDSCRADFVARLAVRYRIALVTNMDLVHLHYLSQKVPFSHFFRGPVIASCEVGARKPDDAVWQKTIEILGVAPDECVFVDDNADFVYAWNRHWRARRYVPRGVVATPFNFYRTMRLLAAEGIVWDGM